MYDLGKEANKPAFSMLIGCAAMALKSSMKPDP